MMPEQLRCLTWTNSNARGQSMMTHTPHNALRNRARDVEDSVQKLRTPFATVKIGIYEERFDESDEGQTTTLFLVRRGEDACKDLTAAEARHEVAKDILKLQPSLEERGVRR